MDKQTLQSTRVITDAGTVAVATICDGKLIISPIQGVLSVNPTLPHLDVKYKRAEEEAKDMGEGKRVFASGGVGFGWQRLVLIYMSSN